MSKQQQQGYMWYPRTWWTSQTREKLRGKPTETLLYRELIDKLYMEGGVWLGTLQGCRSLLLGMRLTVDQYASVKALFTVSDDNLWSHRKVDEQLKKSKSGRESADKRWERIRSANGSGNGSPIGSPNGSPNTNENENNKRKRIMPNLPSGDLAARRKGVRGVGSKFTPPPTPPQDERPSWAEPSPDES